MPYACTCLECGKKFYNDRPRKFCSLECFLKYKRKISLQKKKQLYEMLEKAMMEAE